MPGRGGGRAWPGQGAVPVRGMGTPGRERGHANRGGVLASEGSEGSRDVPVRERGTPGRGGGRAWEGRRTCLAGKGGHACEEKGGTCLRGEGGDGVLELLQLGHVVRAHEVGPVAEGLSKRCSDCFQWLLVSVSGRLLRACGADELRLVVPFLLAFRRRGNTGGPRRGLRECSCPCLLTVLAARECSKTRTRERRENARSLRTVLAARECSKPAWKNTFSGGTRVLSESLT